MPQTKKRGGRTLTAGEITLLRGIFASGVTFDQIRIHNGYINEEEKKNFPGRSHASGNDIYLVGGDWAEDLSETGTMEQLGTLVHEVAHVWQFQNGIKKGKLDKDDDYHYFLMDHYEFMSDSYWQRIEWKIKDFQKKYKGLDRESAKDSVRVNNCELVERYNSAINKEDYHLELYKKDKHDYWKREGWDPVYQFGPQPLESQGAWAIDPGPWTIFSEDRLISPLGAGAQPRVGERLSDFLWRSSPFIQKRFGTKNRFVETMRNSAFDDSHKHHSSASDYNYTMQGYEQTSFLKLRVEAQAQLVTDYFYLKRGVDPRTVMPGGDYRPRPPLEYYESIIPFLPKGKASFPLKAKSFLD